MIALDSSALLAIALREVESDAFTIAIGTNRCVISAVTALESHMVLRERMGAEGVEFLDAVLGRSNVTLTTFDGTLLPIARVAFDRYGKGRHRAGLNFGDCMAYALAKAIDLPLLFKGEDFRLTDIRPALP